MSSHIVSLISGHFQRFSHEITTCLRNVSKLHVKPIVTQILLLLTIGCDCELKNIGKLMYGEPKYKRQPKFLLTFH
jgi:hypothetical protein